MFEEISPPDTPEIPTAENEMEKSVPNTNITTRRIICEERPALPDPFHPRQDPVVRLLLPLETNGDWPPLLSTAEPMDGIEEERPFEDNEYYEAPFANLQNDDEEMVIIRAP